MAKATITVVSGVANVYPQGAGSNDKPHKTLHEGESVDCEVELNAENKEAGRDRMKAQAQADKDAPAAGVAIDEPYGSRAGRVEVAAVEGEVTVRTYVGAAFKERKLEQGENLSAEITEANRVTVAVYPVEE
jgi:hypothetical protein